MWLGLELEAELNMALLSREARESANAITGEARYVELSADPAFGSEFAKALFIPHRDVNRFRPLTQLP